MAIPFSYSNTCGMGLDTFGACNCGGEYAKSDMVEQLPTPVSTPLPHTEPVRKVKENVKGQPKPLLFVNHDAKNLKSQATRSEVTSHLRSAYQPWKHRMQARLRREAGKSTMDVQMKDLKRDDKDSSVKRLTYHQASRNSRIQRDVAEDPESHFQFLTLSPAFYHGNSDPFSSLSINITPLIAELIKFEHAHLHPCIYSTKNAATRAYGTSYLADMHGPAANQAAVYGYLSRAAVVLSSASDDPRFKIAALVLKGRSSVLLREELARGKRIGEAKGKGDIRRKILALMIAELFAHEYAAAAVHSRVLMGLLEERSRRVGMSEGEEFDMRFFFSAVYSEVQRSCMSLTRPCFDVGKEGWVSRLFESVGGDAFRSLLATMDIDDKPLEPAVLGIQLAEIFGEVRTVRQVSEEYSNSPVYGTPTPLALYLPARVVLCLGRMVQFYMDRCAGREVRDLLPRELIHRAAVLGALYWVRKAGHIDSIRVSSTTTIYSAGPMILKKLRESLARFDEIAGLRERELYAGLRFWVLYIGSQEEQGRARKGEVVEKWFTVRLVEASTQIGVYNWQQARLILERYPHPDAAEPHGSTWFSGIFSNGLMRSTTFEGSFEGIMPADTIVGPGKGGLGRTLYESRDDCITWSTEDSMGSGLSTLVDEEVTVASLKRSVQTALVGATAFACPTWDIGQESYWGSLFGSQSMRMLGEGSQANGSRADYPSGGDFDIARYADRHERQPKQAADLPQMRGNNPATGWIAEQDQVSTSTTTLTELPYRYPGISLNANTTTTIPLPASQSHLFHSSAPCWQSDCRAHDCETKPQATINTPSMRTTHRYTLK